MTVVPRTRYRLLAYVAALLVGLLVVLAGGPHPASAAAAAETRVRASSEISQPAVGPPQHVSAGQHRGYARNQAVLVVATGVAAKSVDEAGALVRYDAMAASRNLLGQVGEGYARTPSGYTVSAHAAERIVYGAPGRSPTTLSRVDDILNNPTRTMMRDNGTIRVYQGKDWVAVRDTGPIHIVTVMVR